MAGNSAVTGPSGKIARAFVKTQRRIFPQIYVFAARRPDNVSVDTIQNEIVVATKDKQRLDIREIVKRAAALDKGLFPDPINDLSVAYYDGLLPDQDVPVLTGRERRGERPAGRARLRAHRRGRG